MITHADAQRLCLAVRLSTKCTCTAGIEGITSKQGDTDKQVTAKKNIGEQE